jgi:hypothetical protein
MAGTAMPAITSGSTSTPYCSLVSVARLSTARAAIVHTLMASECRPGRTWASSAARGRSVALTV